MIEKGNVTTTEWRSWNVYGGSYDYPPKPGSKDHYSSGPSQKYWENLLQDNIHKVGIDWDKTQMPKSNRESQFEGTFTENSPAETLLGDLHFYDGSKLTIGVGHAEQRFAGYAQALASLMHDKERVKKIFGEK